MAEKMIFCKACGKEIAKSAKMCPHCGKSNKRPFWFTLLIIVGVIIVISIIGKLIPDSGSSKGAPTASSKGSTSTDATTSADESVVEELQNVPSGATSITIADPLDIPFLHNDPRIKIGETHVITFDGWFNEIGGNGTVLYVYLEPSMKKEIRIELKSRIMGDYKKGDRVRVVFLFKPTSMFPRLDPFIRNTELVSIQKR
jgi:RNA polymerase subunit RPABC4/transcription elongation factor Spt4